MARKKKAKRSGVRKNKGDTHMLHTFSVPYEFEGETYKEIEINLDGLKGSDIAAVRKQWSAAGNFAPMATVDSDFCARIAAKATKKPIEFFEEMPAKDYCKITQEVTNFLLG